MKRHILLSFFLLITIKSLLVAQNPVGKVIFHDDTTLEFQAIDLANMAIKNQDNRRDKGIMAFFENSYRMVPFSKIDYFEIVSWEKNPDGANYLANVKASLLTKTGITTVTNILWCSHLEIRIFDALTGEMKKQKVYFADNNKLNIKAIDFY